MQRLTKKADKYLAGNGIRYLRECKNGDFFDDLNKLGEYEDLEEQMIAKTGVGLSSLMRKYFDFLDDMVELANYRQLEEQGLLLRLPCKVEDKYYRISRTCSMGGEEEKGKFFPTPSDCEYWCTIEKPCDKGYIIEEYTFENIEQILDKKKYIGDGIFLTRKEAEAKLKELESKE